MAQLEPTARGAGPLVHGLVGTGFRVGDTVYPRGLLLTPAQAIDWVAPALADLDEGALAPLLALDPPAEFLLLGTGARLSRPAPALLAALDAKGLGVELMDSRAAARAWGLLRGEGRTIAAALLPLG